jgi:hypothetical protein
MQFRKSTSILLAIFILFSNLGLAFNVHYCEDRIASISLNTITSEPCLEDVKSCCATQPSHDECCSNKVIKAENKHDDFWSKSFKLDFQQIYLFEKPFFLAKENLLSFSKKEVPSFYCDSNAPPFYKLYCQLVLYA